jgi:hypothetical protein
VYYLAINCNINSLTNSYFIAILRTPQMSLWCNMSDKHHESEHSNVPVYIDRVHYDVPGHHVLGQVLRNLPNPPVSDDRDLWEEIQGPVDDELIRPDKTYEVKTWTHYYTSPKTINPGAS